MGRCLLILGNGGAALSAVRAARSSGYDGEICLVSDTSDAAFNPMLAPYYLKGVIPWERCFPFGTAFYRDYGVSCRLGSAVQALDPICQQVTLADSDVLTYDQCLIATGASPVIPPVPGLQGSPRACVVRTAASVKEFEKNIGPARRAIVLGASFVGLKVAEILMKRRIEVVVMDVAGQVLPGGAHPFTAVRLKALFEGQGVEMRLGCTISGMESSEEGVSCYLSSDITEEADLVVACTGVRPNTAFLDPAQLQAEQGVAVDGRLSAGMPNLYAAGDVCRTTDALSGSPVWLGTWRNACQQGWIAGSNMAGRDVSYSGAIPENITPFFDWSYAQVGDVRSAATLGAEWITFGDGKKNIHGLLAFVDGLLVAVNLLNCTELAGLLRRAIVTKSFWKDGEKVRITGPTPEGIEASLLSRFLPISGSYSPRYAFLT